eukprot:6246475-Prymnesium_polylepis.1
MSNRAAVAKRADPIHQSDFRGSLRCENEVSCVQTKSLADQRIEHAKIRIACLHLRLERLRRPEKTHLT